MTQLQAPSRNAQLYIFGLLDSEKCDFHLLVANIMEGIMLDNILHATLCFGIMDINRNINTKNIVLQYKKEKS